MRMRDALQMATGALAANPVRSLLTMLGIVIGVGCVVCMAAIGAGARARVVDQIRAFGANVLLVNPGTKIKDGVRGADAPKGILTTGDAKAIAELPLVALSAPSVFGNAQVVHGSRNWGTTVNGTTPDHFTVREWRLKSGRMFLPEEDQTAAKVAILGSTVAESSLTARKQSAKSSAFSILRSAFSECLRKKARPGTARVRTMSSSCRFQQPRAGSLEARTQSIATP